MESNTKIKILDDEEQVAVVMSSMIEKIANSAIDREDIFKIGLSGGSIPTVMANALPRINTDWSKWRFFFCDERLVPVESGDSTYGMYKTSLIGNLPLTEQQFVTIDPYLTAESAAREYIKKMALYFPPDCLPRFHLLLLGIGPDGHTCSLFPGHRLLEEFSVWVAPITNSPKPPTSRITLTFPVVNNAECCMFLVMGSGKADIVKRILEDKEQLPAALVQPTDGVLYWILDKSAAALLKKKGVGSSS